MKKAILKHVMPLAAGVLAIAGAFTTTSMQSAAKAETAALQWGYIPDSDGSCDTPPIQCSDIVKPQLCRLNDLTGPLAYEKDNENNCVRPYYRVVNGQ